MAVATGNSGPISGQSGGRKPRHRGPDGNYFMGGFNPYQQQPFGYRENPLVSGQLMNRKGGVMPRNSAQAWELQEGKQRQNNLIEKNAETLHLLTGPLAQTREGYQPASWDNSPEAQYRKSQIAQNGILQIGAPTDTDMLKASYTPRPWDTSTSAQRQREQTQQAKLFADPKTSPNPYGQGILDADIAARTAFNRGDIGGQQEAMKRKTEAEALRGKEFERRKAPQVNPQSTNQGQLGPVKEKPASLVNFDWDYLNKNKNLAPTVAPVTPAPIPVPVTPPVEEKKDVEEKAKGGPTKSMNPYLVGEKGPEIYIPESGEPEVIGAQGPEIRTFGEEGEIIPNHKIRAAADGAGGDSGKPKVVPTKILKGGPALAVSNQSGKSKVTPRYIKPDFRFPLQQYIEDSARGDDDLEKKRKEYRKMFGEGGPYSNPLIEKKLEVVEQPGFLSGIMSGFRSANPIMLTKTVADGTMSLLPEKAPLRRAYDTAKDMTADATGAVGNILKYPFVEPPSEAPITQEIVTQPISAPPAFTLADASKHMAQNLEPSPPPEPHPFIGPPEPNFMQRNPYYIDIRKLRERMAAPIQTQTAHSVGQAPTDTLAMSKGLDTNQEFMTPYGKIGRSFGESRPPSMIDGIPSAQWFQNAANKSGEANKFAQPVNPLLADPLLKGTDQDPDVKAKLAAQAAANDRALKLGLPLRRIDS